MAALAGVLALAGRQDGNVDLAGEWIRGRLLQGLAVKAGRFLDIDLEDNHVEFKFSLLANWQFCCQLKT